MLGKLAALPAALGTPQPMLGNNGYFSAANVAACAAAGIEPLLALGRAPHHPSLDERFAATPLAPENPTPLEAMAHRWPRPKAKSSTASASTPRSRCSASSSRFWAFANSCGAVSTRFAARGAW
jgi:hypothetical protein